MVTLLISPDGQAWSDQTPDAPPARARFDSSAIEPDGTVWMLRTDGTDSISLDGATAALMCKPPGLGTCPVLPSSARGQQASPQQRRSPAPSPLQKARTRRDGRSAEWPRTATNSATASRRAGITLWDLTADAAVYEFGPETLDSIEPPEGVREVEEGDDFELTFEDPDTGEDLVTFTREDLEAVFGAQMETAVSQGPEMWVGWSADGENGGWQTVGEAFGLGDAEATASVAVGENYVIASVQVFDVVGSDSSESGSDETVTWSNGTSRWFIARVP